MSETLGVIVAGGRGSRLGLPVPKAMARLGGMTLLERAIALLRPWCETIVVAAPPDCPISVPGSLAEVAIVPDAPGGSVPLAGVVGGLEARSHARALVLGVDFPLMRQPILGVLLARLSGRRAVIPAPGGILQPLAAAYGSEAHAVLARCFRAGERSISAAALSLDPRVLDDEELARTPGGIESFFNLNTPEDLERAEGLLRAREDLMGAA